MSDFGAVYDYALQLEATIPAGEMAQMEAIRPGVMGLTQRQQEEAAKLAAMTPEERAKAEADIAAKREEARAKAEEAARKRAADAAPKPVPAPTPAPAPVGASAGNAPGAHPAPDAHPAPAASAKK